MIWGKVGLWALRMLPYALIVGLFSFCLFYILPQNTTLKKELKDANESIEKLEQDFAKYEENAGKMNGNISGQITIRTQQEQVRGRINDINVKIEDQPYLDDGLRARAGVMRDYQKTSPVFDSNR